MRWFVLISVLAISGCSSITIPQTSAGLCQGLEIPTDDLADTLLEHRNQTPGEVIVSAVKVIRGIDAGCDYETTD